MSQLILGSQSPRRSELLQELGFSFEVRKIDVDEVFPPDLNPRHVAEYLAKLKNEAFTKSGDEVVLTADTVVILDNDILGKPANEKEAFEMLSRLSGQVHEVVSGVCICTAEKETSFSRSTKVKFHHLSDEEIKYYVNKYQPFDKAGAYGIQEWIGHAAIEWIKGSYFNVVGLPTQRVYKSLTEEFNIFPA